MYNYGSVWLGRISNVVNGTASSDLSDLLSIKFLSDVKFDFIILEIYLKIGDLSKMIIIQRGGYVALVKLIFYSITFTFYSCKF